MPLRHSEESYLLEDDLLGVWQQLSMVSEVSHRAPLPGELAGDSEEGQEEEVGDASNEATKTAQREVVHVSASYCPLGLG